MDTGQRGRGGETETERDGQTETEQKNPEETYSPFVIIGSDMPSLPPYSLHWKQVIKFSPDSK